MRPGVTRIQFGFRKCVFAFLSKGKKKIPGDISTTLCHLLFVFTCSPRAVVTEANFELAFSF